MDRVLPSLFARRVMECRAWNLVSRVYRRATTGRDVDDNPGQPQPSPSTSSSSQGEASSPPERDPRYHPCSSETCRYCRAVEKTLLWEDFTFFLNIYLIILLSVVIWWEGKLRARAWDSAPFRDCPSLGFSSLCPLEPPSATPADFVQVSHVRVVEWV